MCVGAIPVIATAMPSPLVVQSSLIFCSVYPFALARTIVRPDKRKEVPGFESPAVFGVPGVVAALWFNTLGA